MQLNTPRLFEAVTANSLSPSVGLESVLLRGMVIGGSFYATMIAVFALGIFLVKTQALPQHEVTVPLLSSCSCERTIWDLDGSRGQDYV